MIKTSSCDTPSPPDWRKVRSTAHCCASSQMPNILKSRLTSTNITQRRHSGTPRPFVTGTFEALVHKTRSPSPEADLGLAGLSLISSVSIPSALSGRQAVRLIVSHGAPARRRDQRANDDRASQGKRVRARCSLNRKVAASRRVWPAPTSFSVISGHGPLRHSCARARSVDHFYQRPVPILRSSLTTSKNPALPKPAAPHL
jgi:hypothetical protein